MPAPSAPPPFDRVAARYRCIRPRCPGPVLEQLLALAALPPGGRVLEIGCGTGQATLPLARRGVAVHALELGPALAAEARRLLAPYPRASVEVADFLRWRLPDAAEPFDLAVSVQAFHWLEPRTAVARLAEVVRRGGAVALVWHADCSQETPFYQATNPIYERTFQHRGSRTPTTAPAVVAGALHASPQFGPVYRWEHAWERSYRTAEYLSLLQTFSDTLALSPAARQRFLREIGAVAAAHGGRVRRHYRSVLLFARRLA